jgi:hypothetical protein
MSDDRMVYLVTHGTYSEYEVLGVFDDEQLAREFAARRNDSSIETWVLNKPHNGQVIKEGHQFFLMPMPNRRLDRSRGEQEVNGWLVVDDGLRSTDVTTPAVKRDDGRSIVVFGRDREHALKMVYDAIAEENARGAGVG